MYSFEWNGHEAHMLTYSGVCGYFIIKKFIDAERETLKSFINKVGNQRRQYQRE